MRVCVLFAQQADHAGTNLLLLLATQRGENQRGRVDGRTKKALMNEELKKKRTNLDYPGLVRPPFYPVAAKEILNRLRSSLEQQNNAKVTFEQIARMTGLGTSTVHYWWSESVHDDLIALLCVIEQLTPNRRQQILTTYCRVLPTLDHPRLAHDLRNITLLVDLLRRKTGFTLITGGTDSARAFVFGTLAHAFPAIHRTQQAVAGIDLHASSALVPIATLVYARQPRDPLQLQDGVRQIWPEISQSAARALFLNGVWSVMPEVRNDLLRWSRRKHIILAENEDIPAQTLRPTNRHAVRILRVSTGREHGAIRLESGNIW